MEKGTLLLASSGKEFQKPTGILANSTEVKKARKEAMGRLGLDFLDSVGGADDMDLDKELAADEPDVDVDMAAPPPSAQAAVPMPIPVKIEDEGPPSSPTDEFLDPAKVKKEAGRSKSSTPQAAPSPAPGSSEDTTALSARERNRLKRKRKPGNAAVVGAPPPSQGSGAKFQATTAGGNKARLVAADEQQGVAAKQQLDSPKSPTEGPSQDRVVIDPTKGGAVAPKTESKSKALEVQPGTWIWDGLVKLLEVDLFSVAWEVRHGAAMALREVLKHQGKYGGMKGESRDIPHSFARDALTSKLKS